MTNLTPEPTKWYRTGRGRVVAAAVVLAAAFGVQAIAESRPGQHARQFVADGGLPEAISADFRPGAFSHGPRFGPGRGSPFADMTEEEIDAMIARGVAHVAIEIDATDEQRDAITELVLALAGEVRPVPEDFREAGEEMRALLLAEEVDTEAIEALRAERMAEADRISREVVGTMTQVAGLLTPEQRRTVTERLEWFREMRERRRMRDE